MKIVNVIAREILDSRGNPTIEVDIVLENGIVGRASIPSGASTGSREMLELRDDDSARYLGKGVLKAVSNVNDIIKPVMVGCNVEDQLELDRKLLELDGTVNKSKLGANAMLGVSIACLKASALSSGIPLYKYVGDGITLPVPMMNILNGGAHADNSLDFQEFMIIPQAKTIKERIRIGSEIFHTLKSVLQKNGYHTGVGDEGGFAPDLSSNTEALDYIMMAIKEAGYKPGIDVFLAIDVAASEFYTEGIYNLVGENKHLNSHELVDYYVDLVNKYPIISIEDGLDEGDWDGFKLLTEKLGNIQLVGDDLFVTNKNILMEGIKKGICNSILIKPNQIGTYSEMLETINLAKANNYTTVISHRSGETEDTFISDVAVGLNLGQIKTGSMSRTDRICKYNELIRIEEDILK